MKCPKCNKVYSEENVFCVDCGTRLVDDDSDLKQGNPIERFSTRVKTTKPKSEAKPKSEPKNESKSEPKSEPKVEVDSEIKEIPDENKLDILILQNRELIKQNNKIIELLEKLAD